MAYKELIKKFNCIRDYMREFYVYGFKSRGEYTEKSARSYDNEKRRIESWLGDYMQFRQTSEGKNIFISIDSRVVGHNPLYKAWKAKSFTDGDITLHFILFDILSSPDVSLTTGEIAKQIDEYVYQFSKPRIFDESTIRKKLREYISEGLLHAERQGKAVYYSRFREEFSLNLDLLDYFSEVMPCGVIGSFLLDKVEKHQSHFAFKHHYITETMDSDILCLLFMAIREKCTVVLEIFNKKKNKTSISHVVPLKIRISVQGGRQYLMGYTLDYREINAFRIDNIVSVKFGERCDRFEQYEEQFGKISPYIWGVNTKNSVGEQLEHVEFIVYYKDDEQHIRNRLEREKRCGTVIHMDNNHSKFVVDVFDSNELIPWIRTFICRIIDLHFSNKDLENKFRLDMDTMYELYGVGGDD